ncbi:NAD(P)/FAD-dependent oxidoreductase [Actinoallomurus rhizosphaericola]|uniref:NAD(P)/FAD-dependent oxidoreductase n=1 Tax=Actinoallomurus rhizosphaericola TaxID=2952536 RepID=UPI002093EDC6|nr:FAD-binding oxidoreductase [Actinoallomurus rhizosphaericola]MCO5996822.1 FAD-binding oxidoreductase [Actinoallomurus rhizosphaericola]
MRTSLSRPRVAVLGGGIIGVSTAARLARRGADVVLVTAGRPADGASGRSLSWLNSFGGDRSEAYHRLRVLGIDRYRTFANRVPASAGWLKFDGGLTWAPPGEADGHRAAFEHMRRNGYDAHWLARDEVADWTPGVDPAAISDEGAIFNPGEGWVDLVPLISWLVDDLTAAGGRVVEGAGAASVTVEGDRVAAVRTASGERIEVDAALVATGADVPRMAREFGAAIDDATPPALLVRARPAGTELRAVLNTPRVAVRPAPGGALMMDSDAAAREVVEQADGTYEVKEATVEGLLREASAVLAGNPALVLDSYGVGRKPIPGDGEPVFGELDQVRGLHVAFTHSGATLGLIAGELLADEIVTGEANPLLEAFRPGRFQ